MLRSYGKLSALNKCFFLMCSTGVSVPCAHDLKISENLHETRNSLKTTVLIILTRCLFKLVYFTVSLLQWKTNSPRAQSYLCFNTIEL